ncbi:hypothetical protein [Sulfurimonas sp.]|uniref:hypothetical protein n=1 Tax=Sulfurimonas sp. TaxID=2022749 RepID=UPI0019EA53C9|nr:hypothetical protein [Sulfurimonas sp.]MBE0515531.1 hypothetical protein [Sulfurimonas sp.]
MSKKSIEGICKLCKSKQMLINSHIIPKFLHKKIDPKRNTPCVIYENSKVSNKNNLGSKEFLLCENCDNVILSQYENYFNQVWYKNSVLPDILNHKDILSIDIDYDHFLLFHLSIFWRMSVSSLSAFRDIDFGEKHNEQIRSMLLNNNNSKNPYRIVVKAIEQDKKLFDKIIVKPVRFHIDSHNIYSAIYGGCEVRLKISSHGCKTFDDIAMSDKKANIFIVNYQEIEQLQKTSDIIKNIEYKNGEIK